MEVVWWTPVMWIDGITLTFHLTAGFDLGLDEEAGRGVKA